MFKELFTESNLDFEEALYQSGFEWDYENEKKKIYKVFLGKETKESFIKQMQSLGKITFNNEKLFIDDVPELAQKLIEGK